MGPLSSAAAAALAAAIGDRPESTISLHLLARGLGRAYAVGQPPAFAAAVVQETADPREPVAFGSDPDALWAILRDLPGWDCVSVPTAVAAPLGRLVQAATGRPVRYYGDVYYRLDRPAAVVADPAVRLLGPADWALLEAADPSLRPRAWGGPRPLLAEGVAAGAVADDRLVAIAFVSAQTGRHADVGATTLPGWRGRGLATSAAGLVAARVQAAGQAPVWSLGEDNRASRRVAEKLGFAPVGQLTYVIPVR